MSWYWPTVGGNGGAGSGGGPLPALTPTLFSPRAQWALDSNAPGGIGADRSGNGSTLNALSTAIRPCPDHRLFPAQAAVWPANGGNYQLQCNSVTVGEFPAAMTCTAKVWYRPADYAAIVPATAALVFAAQAGPADEAYYMYVSDIGHLSCLYTGGVNFDAGTLVLAEGRWNWISMQRTAGGVVRLGLNGVFQTSGALGAQTTNPASIIRLGGRSLPPNVSWNGGMSDLSMWTTRLTDIQLESLRRVAMGL